jgi:hypothetical protein
MICSFTGWVIACAIFLFSHLSSSMPKFILSAALAASLFFTANAAVAQITDPGTAPAVAAPAAAATTFSADSAQAVQKLFRSRRTGSSILGFPGGYMFGYGLVTTIRGVDGAATTMAIGTVLSGISISKGARFSKLREAEILNDYQKGKPLPAYVRNRIKSKHLKIAKPLNATAQRPTW